MTLTLSLPVSTHRHHRPSIFIGAGDVADLLGISRPSFLRKREELELLQGFPPPAPQSRNPLKWRADAVMAWIVQTSPTSAETAGQIQRGALRLIDGGR